jgi:hypothetical protein
MSTSTRAYGPTSHIGHWPAAAPLATERAGAALWLMLPARWAFAGLTFALVALFAYLAHQPDPLTSAASWWMVDGTLVDLACLVTLFFFTRRERISVLDLLAIDRQHIARDLLVGAPLALALIPALAVNQVLQTFFYPGQLPPQIALIHLPLWATAYSVIVWPTLWAFTEQAMYLGYLFPRIELMSRSRILAGLLVIVFWSLQHTALPFVPDANYLVYRTVTNVPIAGTAVVLYLFVPRRRWLPLIVVHWMADVFAALSPALLG